MTILALGPFRLDTRNNLLLRGIEPVALGKRAVLLLRSLVERPGELVSKDALIEAAWSDQIVEENNLTVQIAALRRVFGTTPDGGRWIETLPRRGYRFVGPVVAQGAITSPPQTDVVRDPTPTLQDEAERRQVTAMSCELIGIAGRADGADLEDQREAVSVFQNWVSEVVRRHNGFIVNHLTNTTLVLFGYPAAHEDDAERAVRAGLELCTAVRTPRLGTNVTMRCRAGIATGMVIIGDATGVGQDWRHEIIGDTPDLAAQLQISARPGTVAIGPATRRLIGDLFDYRELGTIDISSRTEPVRIWHVLGESVVESRFEALRGPALSPLVGRDEEINTLLRRWARAKTGDGQIVLISGEPGIGKSRIVAAFAERLQDEPHLRLRYFCSPHHQDSALYPYIDQLSHAAGFTRDDPPATRLEKLEAMLAHAEPLDEDVAFITDLLSLPASESRPLPNLSPQRKKERTLEALTRQLEDLARRQPVVVVFEDVHWIDPTSRELLDLTIERIRGLPVLMIVTFRPEFQAPWIGQPQVVMLTLNRLDRRDRTTLVAQIAGGKALPDDVVAQIADRTDGVPLFVEELTKNVLESGQLREEADRYVLDGTVLVFAIPRTLHASLLARLDRLAAVRQVAQIGAAIGRQFSYALLCAVSRLPEDELRAALTRLVASELVFQRGTPPEAVYSFKHALVQDAAYDSLLRGARRQLHARIAAALETDPSGITENQPELLAQHYAEAGLVEQSVVYWGKAGHRSARRSAMVEAAAHLQKALDQLTLLPNDVTRQRQELELLSSLGEVLRFVKGMSSPEVSLAFARARELWERLDSPSEFLQVAYWQSRNHQNHGELDLALHSDENLLRLSYKRNDVAGLVVGHLSAGRTRMYKGNFVSARSHLEAVLALYDPLSHRSRVQQAAIHPHVTSRAYLGNVLFILGFPDQALAQSKAATAEARGLAHASSLADILLTGARLLSFVGDDPALAERADELVSIAREQGWPPREAQATIYRGWVKVKKGDVADGMLLLRGGLAAYYAFGAQLLVPHHFNTLASACEISGQNEEALTLLHDASLATERTGERWLAAELNRHTGELVRRQGHLDAAEELYQKALGIAVEQDAKLWELRASVSLARLRRDQGRLAEGRDLLTPIYGWFTEGFDTADLKEAKALLDQLG
jgi:DNA-binding winged helix-turn-helix (wHTH) protein/predicted ATPase